MRAVVIAETWSSSVLRLRDHVAIPELKPDEILIAIECFGVNVVDVYQRTRVYPINLLCIAGGEGVGTIQQIRSSVLEEYNLQVRDKDTVFTQGTLAEYVCADSSKVLKLPENTSYRDRRSNHAPRSNHMDPGTRCSRR